MDAPAWSKKAAQFSGLACEYGRAASVGETAELIVRHAVELVDGCEVAGLSVVRGHNVKTLAASGHLARESDQLQHEFGEGPSVTATHHTLRVDNMSAAVARWPQWAPRARSLGIRSLMGFLLPTDEPRQPKVLICYSDQLKAFDHELEQLGSWLAAQAGVALAGAQEVAALLSALQDSRQIGEAVGILMAKHRMNEEDAFALLVRTSQHRGVTLPALALAVAYLGELPLHSRSASKDKRSSGGLPRWHGSSGLIQAPQASIQGVTEAAAHPGG